MATWLTRTPSSTGNRRTFTFSTWIKRGDMNDNRCLFSQCAPSTFNNGTHFRVRFGTTGNLQVSAYTDDWLYTNRLFRDPAAFYHIVLAVDTTNSTADQRARLYINGVEETSFATRNNPSLNFDTGINVSGSPFLIGADDSSAGTPSARIMSNLAHTYLIDGLAIPASSFGETDSTSGIWKPLLSPSLTYGTNGFKMEYAPASPLNDTSGQTNHFTLGGGTLTTPNDNPQNNYCKMNPLDSKFSAPTLTNCNTTIATTNATWSTATQWLESGLWYWEVNPTGTLGGGECLGILDLVSTGSTRNMYNGGGHKGAVVRSGGNVYIDSSDTGNISPSGDLWASGDTIGIYMDLNALKIYFAKNGTILNSGTGKTLTTVENSATYAYTPVWGSTNSTPSTANFNFGEGNLGTTALTGTTFTDSNSEGKFKYSPNNSGGSSFDGSAKNFLAICTNNMATGS